MQQRLEDAEATYRSSFGDRLGVLLELFANRTEAAAAAGVGVDQLARYVRGASQPPLDVMARLCEVRSVSLDWLATGKGRMQPGELLALPDGEDAVRVHLYEVRPSAGNSSVIWSEQSEATMIFSRGQLRRMNVRPDGAALLIAKGDSNAPAIEDGDMLLVDRLELEPTDARFVFRRGDAFFVKKLQRLANGNWLLKSDNPEYEPELLPADEAESIEIVARVRQVFRAV